MSAGPTRGGRTAAPVRRRVAVAAAAAVLAAAVPAIALSDRIEGWAIFRGYVPVAGRIDGHGTDLPAHAVRCANCHATGVAPDGDAGGIPIAPLDAATLPRAAARRGGPPSAYDEASFCATLASGVDPAGVTLERTMPRFALDPAACAALWSYVSTR